MPVNEVFGGEEYRAVFEAAPDAIVIVDPEGRIRDLNRSAEQLFGYQRDELLGKSIEDLVPEQARALHRREREAYVKAPRARPMGIGLDLRARRRDGTEVPVEISLSPMRTSRGLFVIAIVRDRTERERLRAFGAGSLRAAEDERLRIARELHDDTAQRLAALLVRLRAARSAPDEEQRRRQLDEVQQEIVEAAEGVRRIARGLRPPSLEEMGLETALRSLAQAIREAHGLRIEIETVADGDQPRLESDAELALYRIVQEALSNVVRHAGASRARVVLERQPDRMVVVVDDDGRGFVLGGESDPGGRGLGLLGMTERARYLGGRIQVESSPGSGTRVQVEIPRAPAGDRE